MPTANVVEASTYAHFVELIDPAGVGIEPQIAKACALELRTHDQMRVGRAMGTGWVKIDYWLREIFSLPKYYDKTGRGFLKFCRASQNS